MTALQQIKEAFKAHANREKASVLQRYFKTGTGEYAEGDIFLGIPVPEQRKLAKEFYHQLSLNEIETLLNSSFHEHRLIALFILVLQFNKTKDEAGKKEIIDLYLDNWESVNNWDLVDSSAPYLLGAYLFDKPKDLLYNLAESNQLWKQRMAIIATYYFIKKNSFADTLALAKILLHHPHDLIHKATGWMLREVGNRNPDVAQTFLAEHYHTMPRTMLRYAIEKYPAQLRQQFMKGEV